jgi:hypothetical protein
VISALADWGLTAESPGTLYSPLSMRRNLRCCFVVFLVEVYAGK